MTAQHDLTRSLTCLLPVLGPLTLDLARTRLETATLVTGTPEAEILLNLSPKMLHPP